MFWSEENIKIRLKIYFNVIFTAPESWGQVVKNQQPLSELTKL